MARTVVATNGRTSADRYTYRSYVGTYTGDGTDNRLITTGFQPKLVLFFPEGTITDTSFSIPEMPRGTLGCQPGAVDFSAVCQMSPTGFVVSNVAALNTNAVVYHYIAFAGTNEFVSTGTYVGNATDNRNLVDIEKLLFTPAFLGVKSSATTDPINYRFSNLTGDATLISSGVSTINYIQQVINSGFNLGTNAGVNASGGRYWYFALAPQSSQYQVIGSYVGTGVARSITGLQFRPDFLMIKGNVAQYNAFTTSTFPTGLARPANGVAATTNIINSLDANGFTVGTSNLTNQNGITYYYIAGKAGKYKPPVTRVSI